MQRPSPKDANRAPFGWLRNTFIDTLYATLTKPIERQYIRAIRSFLLVSNLGCRGVNRRCLRATLKTLHAFAPMHENVGKRARDESGKYPVNEDDEERFAVPVKLRGLVRQCTDGSTSLRGALATKQSIYPLCRAMDCFASLAMTEGAAKTKMPGTRPGMMSSLFDCQRSEETYAWLATVLPSAACAAANRAMGTR
jgi:hypothetical protein